MDMDLSMTKINDLRSALEYLKQNGHMVDIYDKKINLQYDLANHYVEHGAGVPGSPNCKEGNIILYKNVNGYTIPVLMGVFASRERNNLLLSGKTGSCMENALHALANRIEPVKTASPICQEVVVDANINIKNYLPIPTLTPLDAGPYIAMGLVFAKDPVTGVRNCSIHRLCIHDNNRMSIWIVPFHHLHNIYKNAMRTKQNLPISINIGLDPAIYFASCFSDPVVKYGDNELAIAGGLRNTPVHVSDCVSVGAECISNAEIVIEGEITAELAAENPRDKEGFCMPEFLGYNAIAKPEIPVITVKAITHRKDPVYQTLLGPGKEQSDLLGIPAEVSILKLIRENIAANFVNAYYSSAGGGLLFLILQIKKQSERDDAVARQAGVFALSVSNFLKHVLIIDEDVNIYSHEDVFWAMTTRFQADKDITVLPQMPGFAADFSQNPFYSKNIEIPGITAKAVFDCTVPFKLKNIFKRSFY